MSRRALIRSPDLGRPIAATVRPTVCRGASTTFTLERGWGDQYRWERPGQDFPHDEVAEADGTMRDGCYLVSVTADREHRLTETHENDHVAYALIKVAERGTGDVACETGGEPAVGSPRDRRP